MRTDGPLDFDVALSMGERSLFKLKRHTGQGVLMLSSHRTFVRRLAKRRRGVSFVEVTIVVLIMGITAAATVPSFHQFLSAKAVDCAADRLKRDLELTRERANRTSSNGTITFAFNRGAYRVMGMEHPDHPGQPYDVFLNEFPYGVRFKATTLGGNEITFPWHGRPDEGGLIVLERGHYSRVVSVDANSGTVEIQ